MALSQYVKCSYVQRVSPWPYSSMASRLAVSLSFASANWGRYSSAEVLNELTMTSVGSEAS